MKHTTLLFAVLFVCGQVLATQTTYTFTDEHWNSKVGTVKTNNTTDGWLSVKDGTDYYAGYGTAEKPRQVGVHITTTTSGAGATSVIVFENVRKIVFNYATGSKSRGSIQVQVGDNEVISQDIVVPNEDKDVNRDMEFELPALQSGKITFAVTCTKNPIYLNSVTVKAENGSPNISGLTADVFELVTDASILGEGDEIMFGVQNASYNYVMGVYDYDVSHNNIHAVKATYAADRQSVNEVSDAVYTLHIVAGSNGLTGYVFEDYTGYYLVASGGNPTKSTNNYLTIWDDIYSTNYGNYGLWSIAVAADGAATIQNQGNSASNKLQFNPNGTTPIFSCYKEFSQQAVVLYRKTVVEDPTEPFIKAPLVNFGTVLLEGAEVSGSKQIEVNAVNLKQAIQVSLKQGEVFAVDQTEIDQDGDYLTLSYQAVESGKYVDTLVLQSGETRKEVAVLLTVDERLTIAQAKELPDLTDCYLQDVVVTKKHSMYIFVEDETGAMLIFDSGNLYGQGIKQGDVLSGVHGSFRYYYGNPQLAPSEAFSVKGTQDVQPTEQLTALTEEDACRYISVSATQFNYEQQVLIGGEYVTLDNRFQIGINVTTDELYDVTGIAYFYNEMQLWPISIEKATNTATDNTLNDNDIKTIYSITGEEVSAPQQGIYLLRMTDGTVKKTIKTE